MYTYQDFKTKLVKLLEYIDPIKYSRIQPHIQIILALHVWKGNIILSPIHGMLEWN